MRLTDSEVVQNVEITERVCSISELIETLPPIDFWVAVFNCIESNRRFNDSQTGKLDFIKRDL